MNPDQRVDVQVDGRAAARFVRKGLQSDPNGGGIDLIAVVNGTCYALQLITGGGVRADQAMATFQLIQTSYRFGA